MKKECSYGEKCFRLNPAHFREYSHQHLESIIDSYDGEGEYPVPERLHTQRMMITDQINVLIDNNLYTRGINSSKNVITDSADKQSKQSNTSVQSCSKDITNNRLSVPSGNSSSSKESRVNKEDINETKREQIVKREKSKSPVNESLNKDGDYRPIIPPTRRPEQFLKVVLPSGRMAAKHAASAPYHIFYTTISDSKKTHTQPNSITFLEILDRSLGELKCSLQINFMVEPGWLLAQYYFAGYSGKKLTILYGEDCADMKNLSKKKPNVSAHYVSMATPFGKHHTKMMLLCYEDGSLRVVVSTANLYVDDWENRTQGLWFSPRCAPLPAGGMPYDGESPTMFKRSLLRYLHHYQMPQLTYYVDWVKRCDFSHINVFLVASAPGSHFDTEWGMTRAGALLRQHCCVPPAENSRWPLLAQASSLGSYGKDPKLWLTGDFLHHFTKIKEQPQTLSASAELKLIYPSLENVKQSHDDLLGGGCLPYAAEVHAKQPWLNDYLYQWRATSTHRNQAMPHIKSYTRLSPDGRSAAYFLLTSANVSKAAWGSLNKGNRALRIMSYEAGVLLLPTFVIKKDVFPLAEGAADRLQLPYDVPPVRYAAGMSPWVSDYLS
ncbi:probable tyrosyl-DNA phosphodiesterase isoform X3 [Battus philenor]